MPHAGLARRLTLFDATMIVMGGIVGSGIFINPYVVARQVHTPALVFGAWLFGGMVALLGAFLYAELAARRPDLNGQYAYLREAYHPLAGFLYGWVLLLVIQTGGMAAVAVTFARYFLNLTRLNLPDWSIAIAALAILTLINCYGVRAGSNTQSLFMLLKIVAIGTIAISGLLAVTTTPTRWTPILDQPAAFPLVTAFGAAATPVLFAYGGWQTASFMAGEMANPARDLARAMLIGVLGVLALYLSINFAYIRVLGVAGLADTTTPAVDITRRLMGPAGETAIALAISISTFGFLSQAMLTAPRVYFSMASDGLFFPAVAKISESTRVPVVAIVLQGVWAIVIALSGRYEQILNYVVSVDFLFIGLTGSCVFYFRRQSPDALAYAAPGHPYTTILFCASCWFVVVNTIYRYPYDTILGLLILLSGIPAYAFWRRQSK
ncbi:MAG: amino acid permease [Acidobacteria bacterium]|nr:amino acid permease [Acidobacteriota bacterium]